MNIQTVRIRTEEINFLILRELALSMMRTMKDVTNIHLIRYVFV